MSFKRKFIVRQLLVTSISVLLLLFLFFPRTRGLWTKVRRIILHLRFFICLFIHINWRSARAHTFYSFRLRISPQWLSELKRLWMSVSWRAACKLLFWRVPILCLYSTVRPLGLPCVKGVYVSGCNLPPALLAERPGSFTCYCGNTGVERVPK